MTLSQLSGPVLSVHELSPAPMESVLGIAPSLIKELLPLYKSAFLHHQNDTAHDAAFVDDLVRHLEATERVSMIRRNKRMVAIVMGRSFDHPIGHVYHLQGILVCPTLQGSGLAVALLHEQLKVTGAHILAFHTQSARMVGLAAKLCRLSDSLANELAGVIGSKHPSGSTDHNRYGSHSIYGDLRAFRPLALEGLNYAQGDARICAGFVQRRTE